MGKIAVYLNARDWAFLVSVLRHDNSGAVSAHLADKINLDVAAALAKPARKLSGAALASFERARAAETWEARCTAIIRENGPLNTNSGQKKAIALCRELTGMSFMQAKHATDDLIEKIVW